MPNLAWVALAAAAAFWVLIERTPHGHRSATGQNLRAARLGGVPVEGVRSVTYVLSALMAALAGFLLSCFSGGAALNMEAEYLLMSIAVVVIGGSSTAGPSSNVPGIWGVAMFMFLIASLLNSYGLGAGALRADGRAHHRHRHRGERAEARDLRPRPRRRGPRPGPQRCA